jgi:hypothetical protein
LLEVVIRSGVSAWRTFLPTCSSSFPLRGPKAGFWSTRRRNIPPKGNPSRAQGGIPPAWPPLSVSVAGGEAGEGARGPQENAAQNSGESAQPPRVPPWGGSWRRARGTQFCRWGEAGEGARGPRKTLPKTRGKAPNRQGFPLGGKLAASEGEAGIAGGNVDNRVFNPILDSSVGSGGEPRPGGQAPRGGKMLRNVHVCSYRTLPTCI